MSIFSDLIEKISGLDLDGSSNSTVEHPCSNCPGNCAIAGEACSLCEPYKKKLIDTIYHVDHIDEFLSQYEVVSSAQAASSSGTITCPYCGGPSMNHYICDYCGAKLSEAPSSGGKIQVSAASEIPNPIMDAQNIIFERYETIVKKFTSDKSQKADQGGFWSDLFSGLIGNETDNSDSILGAKMSEDEIREAASLYGVSVGAYLTGLDNGKYLTLNARKEAEAQGHSSWAPASAGMASVAGIGMAAGGLADGFVTKRPPRDFPQRPSQDEGSRPSQFRPHPDRQPDPKPSPAQNKPEPGQSGRRRPSGDNSSRSPQRSQPAQAEQWKERDPSRRRRG